MELSNRPTNVGCPHCGSPVVISPEMAGQVVACHRCHRQLSAPAAEVDELIGNTAFGSVYRNRLELPGEILMIDAIEAVNVESISRLPVELLQELANKLLPFLAIAALLVVTYVFSYPSALGGVVLIIVVVALIWNASLIAFPRAHPVRSDNRVHLLLKSGRVRIFKSESKSDVDDFVRAVTHAMRNRG